MLDELIESEMPTELIESEILTELFESELSDELIESAFKLESTETFALSKFSALTEEIVIRIINNKLKDNSLNSFLIYTPPYKSIKNKCEFNIKI